MLRMRMFTAFLIALLATCTQGFVQLQSRDRKSEALWSTANDRCDIAVFGGGFGGLYTALELSRRAGESGKKLDIALVEPRQEFVFLPLLYDLTIGTASEIEVCPTYKSILEGTGIRQIRAGLDSFDSPDFNSAILSPIEGETSSISFEACVIAVGASPQSILASVPGASEFAQPFYTAEDARKTRQLLLQLESLVKAGYTPRVAIVGGGYGGVELAASVKRKIPKASVTLLARGAPMKGTRAEPLIDKALTRLGVEVELCSVKSIETAPKLGAGRKLVKTIRTDMAESTNENIYDAVLWTAGSSPSPPVAGEIEGLMKVDSGRLAIDSTLRCMWSKSRDSTGRPTVWALGDCAEIQNMPRDKPAVPRTAQAAMQQSETVAANIMKQMTTGASEEKSFEFQDLGSMLTLGSVNAAVLAPKDGAFAPLFSPVLDGMQQALGIADNIFMKAAKSPIAEAVGLTPVVEKLELSLGGYSLGVDAGAAPGTLTGTLSGAARRAVYAVRMPTNRQRAVAAASAAISTTTALAKESNERSKKNN